MIGKQLFFLIQIIILKFITFNQFILKSHKSTVHQMLKRFQDETSTPHSFAYCVQFGADDFVQAEIFIITLLE
jgi:hypothetical protein